MTIGGQGNYLAVIKVFGIGGGGVNAVNRMVEAGVAGVEFLAVNTDLQSLQQCTADVTVHIGAQVTRGLGSGLRHVSMRLRHLLGEFSVQSLMGLSGRPPFSVG